MEPGKYGLRHQGDMAKCPYYSGVRIKRALKKTSRPRFTDTKTKANIFYGNKTFCNCDCTNCNCSKFKLKKP